MMKRIRLLIDTLVSDRDISELQQVMGEQPLTVVLITGFHGGMDGRFMGAQEVPEPEKEAKEDARTAR